MKKILLLIITTFTVHCYSQITFEKGYYINNTDQKIECFIKNNDWKNNPTDFNYKLSENAEVKTIGINEVKEFKIYSLTKYLRKTVKIDQSSEKIEEISVDKNPIFKEEKVFLKILIEGKANLYVYENKNLVRFLYNVENDSIEQLIFKSYKTSEGKIGTNNRFRQQLWMSLQCSTIKMNDLEKLEFNRNSLISFFSKYNSCSNSDFIDFEKKQKRDLFNLSVKLHLNNSTLSIENNIVDSQDMDFGSKTGFGFSIESEFIIPYNKNKWSILFEPTYQSFKGEESVGFSLLTGGAEKAEIEYTSIEIPLGVRHYFILNQNSKLFLNAAVVIDIDLNSTLEFKKQDDTVTTILDLNSDVNLALGMGYKLNDKYSIELRYLTSRGVLTSNYDWTSDYKTASLLLGYTLF